MGAGSRSWDGAFERSRLCPVTSTALDCALVEFRQRLIRLCDDSSVRIVAYDRAGRRIYSSPAFDELVGYDGAEFQGKRPPFPYWGGDLASLEANLKEMLSGEAERRGVRAVAATLRHRSGHSIPVLMTSFTVHGGPEQPLAHVFFATRVDLGERVPREALQGPDIGLPDLEAFLAPIAAREAKLDLSKLSPRERAVLDCLRTGAASPDIGRELGISVHTARNHIKAIYGKLGVHSAKVLIARLGSTEL